MSMMHLRNNHRWLALPVCLVVMALRLPVSLLLRWLWPDAASNAISYDLAVMVQEVVLWLLPALFLRPWWTKRVGNKVTMMAATMAAPVMGALVQVGMAALALLLPWEAPARSIPMPDTPLAWVLATVSLVVVPALCEEAFFRGCVTTYLRDAAGTRMAVVGGTLIFALMHGDAAGLPTHLVVSLCCTLLMLHTGYVWPGMLLHMGNNAMALALPLVQGTPWLALLLVLPLLGVMALVRSMRWGEGKRHLTGVEWIMFGLVLAWEIADYFF